MELVESLNRFAFKCIAMIDTCRSSLVVRHDLDLLESLSKEIQPPPLGNCRFSGSPSVAHVSCICIGGLVRRAFGC